MTRRAPRLVAMLWLVIVGGCTARSVDPIRIRSESSPSLDVSAYRTYGWRSGTPEDSGQGARDSAALSDWRIRNAVERQLAAKGYQKPPSGTVDFLIEYSITVTEKNTESIGDYMDYRDRGGSMSPQEAYVFGYQEGSLILEIVDARTRQLMWRASATAVVNPQDNDSLTADAVRGMLQRFPSRGQ